MWRAKVTSPVIQFIPVRMVHSPLIDVPGGSSIVFSFIGYKTLTLSPDFSKNMTVIKGDSAAAIYGEKGKNVNQRMGKLNRMFPGV